MSKRFLRLLLVAALCPVAAHAQGLRGLCGRLSGNASTSGDPFCNALVDAVRTTQARAVIVSAGANPVPGAPSTLGMRLGAIPRIGVDARFTAARLELPPIDAPDSNDEIKAVIHSWNVDATVGLFSGLSLFPTVGGLGSIDLLASVGMISLPNDEGFADPSPKTYSVGARVGLLQESFTAPGVSVTGMYRKIGGIRYGDPQLRDRDSYFEIEHTSVLSGRAIVGKRLLMLGTTVGAGYDHFASDIAFRGVTSRDALHVAQTGFDVPNESHTADRTTFFGSLQFTLLVASITAEGGWQGGGESFPGSLAGNRAQSATKKGYYGTFSLRLTI